ncbi:Ku protein [Loktanella sp. DJP18]|uniref:non-homologous end joining protein Ku n=1 Tax=Loktanella sp. DJP18 TaxID=3409788 RepID=UPI003BB4B4D0
MASRALWKGQLRLSLVSIPVEIHSATRTSSRTSFRQIHEPSGKPVKYEKTVAGIGPIDAKEIVKGYDTGEDSFILIDPEELEAIRLETKKTFEMVQFVDACEISPLYFDKPYYIVPTDDLAQDAYRVIRDALRTAGKVGLGQFTMRGKEYLGAVKPCGDGLLMETLHYADELRDAEPLFNDIADDTSDKDLLEVATALIDRKSGPFDATAFTDHYAVALRDLIAAKRKNKKTKHVATADDAAPHGENVVDLMAALKQSLKGTKAQAKTPAKGGRKKAS